MGRARESELKILRTTQELRQWRHERGEDVGFVPTMGNLHAGHMSLLGSSLQEHESSVLSIFVNPTQFGEKDDFARYPRTLDADAQLAQQLLNKYPHRQLVIFAPASPEEIYPEGFSTVVSVPKLDGFLEGKFRPGHFDGVATVVYLLFQLVKPRVAYFGRKDYQQYRVIKRMARDLEMPVRVKGMPIIRDEHGLALSSRNQFLKPEERKAALHLIHTLEEARRRLGGEARNVPATREWMEQQLSQDARWQYLEIREARTLSETIHAKNKVVFLGLLKLGTVRLLDNLEMTLQ